MWQIYDELIDGIPSDITVKDCLIGLKWCIVRSEISGGYVGSGLAMTLKGDSGTLALEDFKNKPLRKLAGYAKSWNFSEACVGVAALNSYYNTIDMIGPLKPKFAANKKDDAFRAYKNEFEGKNVAVIGHFPGLEEYSQVCNLSILERLPSPGDYPDSACEYILPHQDYVFITGTAITNKTLPRLLQLSKNAKVIMVGPSVVMSPILFDYGVDVLAGSIVTSYKDVARIVRQGGCTEIFNNGANMVRIEKQQ